MRLYKDRALFNQAVAMTARYFKTDPAIVEKDYYITVFLRQLAKKLPQIALTGSTSLRMCHKVANRFSDGLDLAMTQDPVTKEQKKLVKKTILGICSDLGFALRNEADIRSSRDLYRYEIDYSPKNPACAARSVFLISVNFAAKAYPCEKRQAASMISDYMLATGREDFIRQYKLQPFSVRVQAMDRTLIDKIFALCDYYLTGRVSGHARHLYDIGQMADHVVLDDAFASLFQRVRAERKSYGARCVSAYNKYNIPALLTEILDREVYKNDYHDLTEFTLFDDISYEESAAGLQKLISCGLLETR